MITALAAEAATPEASPAADRLKAIGCILAFPRQIQVGTRPPADGGDR